LTEIGAADVTVWKESGEFVTKIDRQQLSTNSTFEFTPSYEASSWLQQCFPLFTSSSSLVHCSDNTFGSVDSL